MKKVTVVIPTADRPRELERALLSVLKQTYSEFSIIVVGNNSKDPQLLASLCRMVGEGKVEFFYLELCENANVARNFGAQQAKTDLIAYLDSDDEWEAEHLSNAVKALNDSDASFVYGATKIFDGISYQTKLSRNILKGEHPVNFLLGFSRGYAQTSSYLIKKECFMKVNWDESLYRHQDYDFFIQVALNFKSVCNSFPDVIIHWEQGVKRNFNKNSVILFLSRYRAFMDAKTHFRYHALMCYASLRNREFKRFFYFLKSYLVNIKM